MALAVRIGGEIVNYDSVQVYRGFDIGSAKPSAEEREAVPHHLIDVANADEPFDAAEFAARAKVACDEITRRGRRPVLVGGTGFYLRALLSGLPELPGRDEALRARIRAIWDAPRGARRLWLLLERIDPLTAGRLAPADRHRVERALEVYFSSGRPISTWERPSAHVETLRATKFGLSLDRSELNQVLDERVRAMYARGLVEETRALLERFPATARPFQTIGYREAAAVASGTMSVSEAIQETARRTRAYAKRQMTWLRAEPGLVWVDAAKAVDEICSELGIEN
ncbi:MAG: tRNA (adenosine(37)-N6)-dimethylallyltransferase MiaA [Thermoanaerobaculia bacterium]|nr:tRNA (adenosine(37)-N6)-dimethylallyltransferase MiaA [Thermoanaerobaculia bacterium]